jgi:hypothetical protein
LLWWFWWISCENGVLLWCFCGEVVVFCVVNVVRKQPLFLVERRLAVLLWLGGGFFGGGPAGFGGLAAAA